MHSSTAGTPQVVCSTGPLWTMGLAAGLDIIADAGFSGIELMVTRDPATQDAEVVARLAREKGLTVTSVHAPFLLITKTVWGLDPLEKIRRAAEMCREVGSSLMVVHPPYAWEARYADWVCTQAAGFEQETGITVAVETMYPRWIRGRRLDGFKWIEPGALVRAAPHVVLDTSHVAVARKDISDVRGILGPRLAHVHLSNNAGDGRDGHLEVDRGVLDVDGFLEGLVAEGYRGAIALEISLMGRKRGAAAIVEMLARNRAYVEERVRPAPATRGAVKRSRSPAPQ